MLGLIMMGGAGGNAVETTAAHTVGLGGHIIVAAVFPSPKPFSHLVEARRVRHPPVPNCQAIVPKCQAGWFGAP